MANHSDDALPSPLVAGDRLGTSLVEFVRKCEVHIEEEQGRPLPDNSLIATLCEAVRLAREHVHLRRQGYQLPTCTCGAIMQAVGLVGLPAHAVGCELNQVTATNVIMGGGNRCPY